MPIKPCMPVSDEMSSINSASVCPTQRDDCTLRLDVNKCAYFEQGKSALWSHLLHYQAAQGKLEAPAESPGQSTAQVFSFFFLCDSFR